MMFHGLLLLKDLFHSLIKFKEMLCGIESIIVSLSYKVFKAEFELKKSIACMYRKFPRK